MSEEAWPAVRQAEAALEAEAPRRDGLGCTELPASNRLYGQSFARGEVCSPCASPDFLSALPK